MAARGIRAGYESRREFINLWLCRKGNAMEMEFWTIVKMASNCGVTRKTIRGWSRELDAAPWANKSKRTQRRRALLWAEKYIDEQDLEWNRYRS